MDYQDHYHEKLSVRLFLWALLLLRAALPGFFRQDLCCGTGVRVAATCATPTSGFGVADHSIDDQSHDENKNNADYYRWNHLNPLLLL